ncbi:MAG TPA: hypothetical protein VEL76_35850, partial [Gemmataceae bacterium]|nr:hypothetical protein [Gemmataceae bacterium]
QINFRSDRPRSWLGRGRARFRWGEATNDVRKMDDADSDLGEVIERAPKSREAAEAHYWQARIAQFRSGKESEKPKGDKQVLENFLKRAEEGYKTCLELARANQAPSWEEAALTAWAHLALAEGERRKEQATPKADHYVKLAEKLALDLARFNVPEAALIQSRAVVIRTGNLKEAQRICAGGMQQHRTQDKGSLLKLRLNDIHLRLRMEGADMAMLVKEARAVAEEVVAARLDDDTRGFAEGTLGVLLYLSAAKASGAEKDQLTKEAIAQFRAAVKRAPKHGDGYMWRWLLVAILDAKPSRTAAETQEARQRIAEARRMMPASSPYRKNIQELDRRYNDPP